MFGNVRGCSTAKTPRGVVPPDPRHFTGEKVFMFAMFGMFWKGARLARAERAPPAQLGSWLPPSGQGVVTSQLARASR